MPGALILARCAFGALAVGLLAWSGYGWAADRADRSDWYGAARWSAVADTCWLIGCAGFVWCAVLLGLAATWY